MNFKDSGASRGGSPAVHRGHLNNFDGLRLIAALLVLCSHQFVLLGRHEPAPLGDSLGGVAVMMFFVMSGFLVAQSWYHDPHLMRFALRRLLRLWPALMAATVVIALLGALLTSLPLHEYFGRDLRRFVTANAQFRPLYTLPDVFASSPPNLVLSAVNGSWWTIPLEARCYVYLAVLGAIGLRHRWLSPLALAVVVLMYIKTLPDHSHADAMANISYFYIAFFLSGVCVRQYLSTLRQHPRVVAVLVLLCIGLAALLAQPRLAEWAILVPATLWLGSASTPGLRRAARYGDLSYGIYIYAYFMQQLSVRLWPANSSYTVTALVALAGTVALAWFSWHAIEAPALRLKTRLRRGFPDQAP